MADSSHNQNPAKDSNQLKTKAKKIKLPKSNDGLPIDKVFAKHTTDLTSGSPVRTKSNHDEKNLQQIPIRTPNLKSQSVGSNEEKKKQEVITKTKINSREYQVQPQKMNARLREKREINESKVSKKRKRASTR